MADGRDTPNTKDAGADLLHKVKCCRASIIILVVHSYNFMATTVAMVISLAIYTYVTTQLTLKIGMCMCDSSFTGQLIHLHSAS